MPSSTTSRLVPFLLVLGSILSLSVGSSLAKDLLFPLIGPTGTTALRTGFSAIVLLALWRPWKASITAREYKFIALYGVTLGAMNLCFYLALESIPFGLAVAIEFVGPLTVTVLYSRKLSDFIWIALAVTGVLLLLPLRGNDSGLPLTGVLFALGAALCWALYIIFGKTISHLHSGQTVAVGLVFASMVTLPVGMANAGAILTHPHLLAMGLLIALLSSSLPMTMEMAALKRLPHKTFGILVSMEPAVAALVAFFMLSETLTLIQAIAVTFSITAGMGSAITARSRIDTLAT
ncbi:EamA family transporter [Acerihabitans arboris]|uniref:EamA family transporter n=1 Tax=Acerihabitans arboris TaxID=2691583 RepID=A0A845SJA5_9GAMM|nr:EamA family transporter [Acerihabitans arboris]NDL63337.1 EamA family transporter [Acerihabitans arboris]